MRDFYLTTRNQNSFIDGVEPNEEIPIVIENTFRFVREDTETEYFVVFIENAKEILNINNQHLVELVDGNDPKTYIVVTETNQNYPIKIFAIQKNEWNGDAPPRIIVHTR